MVSLFSDNQKRCIIYPPKKGLNLTVFQYFFLSEYSRSRKWTELTAVPLCLKSEKRIGGHRFLSHGYFYDNFLEALTMHPNPNLKANYHISSKSIGQTRLRYNYAKLGWSGEELTM